MPFLSTSRLCVPLLSNNTVKSHSSMGANHSTGRPSKQRGSYPASSTRNIDINTASMNSRGNTHKSPPSDNPWGPPPYSCEEEASPFSAADLHSSQSPFTPTTISTSARLVGDSEYAFLGKFDTVFLVDDSGSMAGRHWKEAEEAIATITPVCTQYDPDGIDLYFLNHVSRLHPNGGYTNITSPAAVQEIFQRVTPYGMTPVGQRLSQILFPYMRRVERMAANTDDYGKLKNAELAVRPINIIVITDGVFSDDAESVILNAARKLDRLQVIPWQVGIQFFQIGSDSAARKHLEQLDDGLCKAVQDDHVRDIVDTVPWKGHSGRTLSGDGILKVVLGAVNKKLDRQKGH